MKNRPPGTTAGTLEGLLRDRDTTESLTVLVAERPAGRASVRLHMRQFDGKAVQETIAVARVRLEQLLKDGAKLTEIREVMTRFAAERGFKFNEEATLDEIRKILEAP